MAMGIDVVPTVKRFRNGTVPGKIQPAPTPMSMAVKIQRVRKRSRKLRRVVMLDFILVTPSQILPTDFVEFLLKRKPVHGGDGHAQKQADPAFQEKESFTKRLPDLVF